MEGNHRELDNQASLYPYSPRAVDFDTVLQSSELGPQRNIGEEIRTKITQKEFRGGGLIASIARVCYGTFKQKKAIIVVIQLLLHSSKDTHQFRHLEVEVSFQPRPNRPGANGNNVQFPIVRNLSPRKVYGIPNTDGQVWSYRVEQQCYIPMAAPGMNSASRTNARNAFEVAPSLSINGKPWSDRRRREMHKACWVIKDKSEPSVGIPDEVNIAVAVEYEDAFQADVKVMLDIPLYQKLLAFPWPEDDPILFPPREPGPFIGEGLRTTKFEALSDTEWATLTSGHENIGSALEVLPVTEKVTVATTNPQTFRVRGIPAEYDPAAVSELLSGLFGLNGQESDIELRSLALDVERRDEKVATISSPRLEAALKTGDEWQKTLPGPIDGALSAGRRHVILDTRFYSFTPLAVPDEDRHLFDIIAFSGLGGHAFGSFKERRGNHMWLRDGLPNDFPHARILIYGYDTKLEDSQSIQDLEAIASTFRTTLKIARPKGSDRKLNDKPILFIAHSLGGIVLKQALIQMADGDEMDKANSQAVRGILFFGVPSQGMDISSLLGIVKGNVNENFLQGLRHDSDTLRNQHREFCQKFPYESCKIMSFYETEYSPTAEKGPNGWKMNGEPALLVRPASATLGSRAWEVGPNYSQPIKRNHSDMVKFHPRDPWYSIVRHVLNDLSEGRNEREK